MRSPVVTKMLFCGRTSRRLYREKLPWAVSCSRQKQVPNPQLRLSNYIKKREFSRARVLVFLGLALCVFTWGLQYKLSLYDPPQAIPHQVPQAKLLANDEPSRMAGVLRAIANEPTARITIHGDGILLFLFVCLSVASLSSLAQEVPPRDVSWHAGPAFFGSLFVRPPPVLL